MTATRSTYIKLSLFYRLLVNATGEFYVIEHVLDDDPVPEDWHRTLPLENAGVVLGPRASTERTFSLRPAPHDRYLELRLIDGAQLLNYWFEEVKPDMEMPDPTPVEIPAHLQVPPTLQDEMRRIVQALRLEVAPEADDIDEEDYEIDSNELPLSPYELAALPLVPDVGPNDPQPAPAAPGSEAQTPSQAAPAGNPQSQPVSAESP